MLSEHKGAPLKIVCDIFDFVNLLKVNWLWSV
jgi:hypothetical protein